MAQDKIEIQEEEANQLSFGEIEARDDQGLVSVFRGGTLFLARKARDGESFVHPSYNDREC